MPESRPNSDEQHSATVEVAFDNLLDILTYHTSGLYRHKQAQELFMLYPGDEETLLLREYLNHHSSVEDAVLSTLQYWYLGQDTSSAQNDDYDRFQEDLTAYLSGTDYSDEPEHDGTKYRLLQGPLLTRREFNRLSHRVETNYPTSRKLGRAVIHRLARRG